MGRGESGGDLDPRAGDSVRSRWRGRLPSSLHEEEGRGHGEAAPLLTSETRLTQQTPRTAHRSPAFLTQNHFLC